MIDFKNLENFNFNKLNRKNPDQVQDALDKLVEVSQEVFLVCEKFNSPKIKNKIHDIAMLDIQKEIQDMVLKSKHFVSKEALKNKMMHSIKSFFEPFAIQCNELFDQRKVLQQLAYFWNQFASALKFNFKWVDESEKIRIWRSKEGRETQSEITILLKETGRIFSYNYEKYMDDNWSTISFLISKDANSKTLQQIMDSNDYCFSFTYSPKHWDDNENLDLYFKEGSEITQFRGDFAEYDITEYDNSHWKSVSAGVDDEYDIASTTWISSEPAKGYWKDHINTEKTLFNSTKTDRHKKLYSVHFNENKDNIINERSAVCYIYKTSLLEEFEYNFDNNSLTKTVLAVDTVGKVEDFIERNTKLSKDNVISRVSCEFAL